MSLRAGMQTTLILALLALVPAPATAADPPRVEARLDPAEAVVGEPVTLVIEVTNAPDATPPILPEIPGVRARYEGAGQPRTFSSIQIVNGRRSEEHRVTVPFHYRLVPERAGTIRIPPLAIDTPSGRMYTTPLSLAVLPEAPGNALVTLEIEASKTWIYVGETVALAAAFATARPVIERSIEIDVPWDPPPAGFRDAEPEPEERESGLVRETREIGGQRREAHVFRRTYIPTTPGEYILDPVTVRCEVATQVGRDLFGQLVARRTAKAVKRGEALRITVRPLPAEGRPEGYDGAVGRFALRLAVNPERCRVGDTVAVTVRVSGDGNLDALSPPVLAETEALRVYEPRSESLLRLSSGRLTGERVYYYEAVPREAGEVLIGPVHLHGFDPEGGAYRTVTAPAIPLAVDPALPGMEGGRMLAPPGSGDHGFEVLARDIAAPWPLGGLSSRARPFYLHPLVGGLVFLPWFTLAGTALAVRWRRRLLDDPALRRSRGARRRALERLTEARGAEAGDPLAGVSAVAAALRGLVADLLDLPEEGLTSEATVEAAEAHGLAGEAVARLQALLATADRARYAGAAGAPGTGHHDEAAALLPVIAEALRR